MFKYILFFSFLFFFQEQIFSQVNKALIWRGFSHSWTYNHRINRLGSFVSMNDSSMNVCHAAASGLGADSCYFTSHYSLVESEQLHFQEGIIPIKLYGREKQLISKTIEVSIPANPDMQKKDHYFTLLNGFDLTAVGNADKLQLLRFSVEDAYYAPAVNELRFLVKVAIAFNCQTLECSRFNQKTTYDLKLHYLIIAGEHNYLTATSKTITENYPWDKKIEFSPTPKQYSINGESEYLLPESTLGLKSMTITLDNAHWMLQYNNNITPLDYNPENGKSTFASDLFFTEWQQGMKQLSAVPKHSRFSSKKSGWCMLDMEVVLLQFREAKVRHQKFSGSLFWEGWNNDPSVPEATRSKKINFED
jgi:hypothetical protein